MAQEKVTPEWHKQYESERKYDRDFKYAAGPKSLKGGIDNPKNWRGGKSEMLQGDPHKNRAKLENKKLGNAKLGTKNKSKRRKTKAE